MSPPVNNQLQSAKAALRKRLREEPSRRSSAAREEASRALCGRLRTQAVWTSARAVLFFAPLPEEADIWPLAEAAQTNGKTVALPRFWHATQSYAAAVLRDLSSDVHGGKFGIREPRANCAEIPLGWLDLVLVPGVAFDARGHRLGRGRGYYDRLLAEVRGVKCGVAFDEQVLAEVPAGGEDARVDCIVTPTRWLEC